MRDAEWLLLWHVLFSDALFLRPAHLGGADGVEKDGRGLGQHHVPKVGVRQRAAPQQQAHEVGWMRDPRLRQFPESRQGMFRTGRWQEQDTRF